MKNPKYQLRSSHVIGGQSRWGYNSKEKAMNKIKKLLPIYPHVEFTLMQINKSDNRSYHSIGTYGFRKNQKTKRYRMVKL